MNNTELAGGINSFKKPGDQLELEFNTSQDKQSGSVEIANVMENNDGLVLPDGNNFVDETGNVLPVKRTRNSQPNRGRPKDLSMTNH